MSCLQLNERLTGLDVHFCSSILSSVILTAKEKNNNLETGRHECGHLIKLAVSMASPAVLASVFKGLVIRGKNLQTCINNKLFFKYM